MRRRDLGISISLLLTATIAAVACSSMDSVLATNSSNPGESKPIGNPFGNYHPTGDANSADGYADITLPAGNSMARDLSRNPASVSGSDPGMTEDLPPPTKAPEQPPTLSDREITHNFTHTELDTPEALKQREIEQGLGLKPSEDESPDTQSSYLARMDYVRILYRSGRLEAALLETDHLIQSYPTDPRLHEMRGTLLDRLGHEDLAFRSWNQALKLDPKNESLRRYVQKRQQAADRGLASQ